MSCVVYLIHGLSTSCQKAAFKVPEVLDISMIEFVSLGYYMEVLTDTNKRRKKTLDSNQLQDYKAGVKLSF